MVREQARDQPERMRELALAVAAARTRQVRPRLATRERDIRIAEVRGALGQEVAHDRRHLDRHVLDRADPVRAAR